MRRLRYRTLNLIHTVYTALSRTVHSVITGILPILLDFITRTTTNDAKSTRLPVGYDIYQRIKNTIIRKNHINMFKNHVSILKHKNVKPFQQSYQESFLFQRHYLLPP